MTGDHGELVVLKGSDGTLRVEHADEVIAITPGLLARDDWAPGVTVRDGTLRIEATNGTFTYRIEPDQARTEAGHQIYLAHRVASCES